MHQPIRGRLGYAVTAVLVLAATLGAGCGSNDNELTVYSGRSVELIGPLLDQFAEETGIDVGVRYGDTAALTALLLEEGDRTDADLFIAQDAGALGTLQRAGLFTDLDDELLDRVPEVYRSPAGQWIGLSGRARVVVYNTERVAAEDLPASILDFTDPMWDGRIGWAPTNGSFQAWLTALRVAEGEDAARAWLDGVEANGATVYPSNSAIVDAVGRGEVDVGFVNHYYLYRFLAEEGENYPARNHFTGPGDVGTLVNVAGAGILENADAADEAKQLLEFLLSDESQAFISGENFEYPLVPGVPASVDILPLEEIVPVTIDLNDLDDLEGTLALLQDTGVLP